MNQIHERDWAADDYWGGHSGMSSNPYDDESEEKDKKAKPHDDGKPSAPKDTTD